MAEKKANRRVQFTKAALREALVDLATETPLSSITVTDICARADINRSTFYLHYQGVHELLQEVEDDIIQHIHTNISTFPLTEDTLASMLTELRSSTRMHALMEALVSDQGDPQFVRRLQRLTYDAFQQRWRKTMPETSESRQLLIYSYVVSGVVSALAAWVRGATPELSALDAVRLVNSLLQHGACGLGFITSPQDGGTVSAPPSDQPIS